MATERRDSRRVRAKARLRAAEAVLVEEEARAVATIGSVVAGAGDDRIRGRGTADDSVTRRDHDRGRGRVAEPGRRDRRGADEVGVILVPRSVRVYFATQPTNLRKSFEGLSNDVRE